MMPDVLMLDLSMPGKDGFEVLDELSGCPVFLRDVAVVITSGFRDFEYLKNMYPELHIAGYIHKPINTDQLEAILGTMKKTKGW